jgi:hypothetical protein
VLETVVHGGRHGESSQEGSDLMAVFQLFPCCLS